MTNIYFLANLLEIKFCDFLFFLYNYNLYIYYRQLVHNINLFFIEEITVLKLLFSPMN